MSHSCCNKSLLREKENGKVRSRRCKASINAGKQCGAYILKEDSETALYTELVDKTIPSANNNLRYDYIVSSPSVSLSHFSLPAAIALMILP